MKRGRATLQMVEIAKRIAVKNGVSVAAVLDKVERSAKKTSFVKSDFFWGDSVITLDAKKYLRPASAARLPRGCGAVAAKNLNGGR